MKPTMTGAGLSHEAVLEQLPLLAGGGLPAPLQREIEAHLQHCADCAREWQIEQRLASAWRAEAAPQRSPEPALQALLARIERERPPQRPRAAKPVERLRGWLAEAFGAPGPRLAMAGLAAVAAGLLLLRESADLRSEGAGYHVLASAATNDPANAAAGAHDLLLAFAPEVSAARRAAVLASIAGIEVGPPNSAGAIRVHSARIDSSERLSAALAELRAQPEVLLAEPAQPMLEERPR